MSRLLYSRRRGHDSEGEYTSEGEDSAISYNSSDSEHSDISSSYYSDSEESDLDEAETEGSGEESEAEVTEEEEGESEQEQPLIQESTTVAKEQKLEHKEIIDYQQVIDDPPQATHEHQHQETTDYQIQSEDSEKRFQEHREYRRKLAEDPSFVPYVGLFWGHDDRYREDLLTEARPDGSQPRFSSNKNHPTAAQDYNRQLDPLMYKKWDHSGYEELLRMDEEDERRKRALIEEGKVEEANNYRPNRIPYNNYSRGPRYGRGGYHNNNNHRPPRQNHRQHEEWPELSKNDETQNKWSTENWGGTFEEPSTEQKKSVTDDNREQVSTVKDDSNDWKPTVVDSNKTDDWAKEPASTDSHGWEQPSASTESNGWGEPSAPVTAKNDWKSTVGTDSTDNWDTQAKTNDWAKNNDDQKQEATTNGWDTTDNNNSSNCADAPIETTHKERWNSKEKEHSDIPTEEKASASWTTNAVEEIQVPTTPSKWTMRNKNNWTDRRNRFNNDNSNSFRHSKPRRDDQKQDKSWKSRKAEKDTTDQEWDPNKWSTSSTTPAITQGWGDPVSSSKSNGWDESTSFDADKWDKTAIDSKESTSNGWDKPDNTNGSWNKPNAVTPTETSGWDEPTTKHELDSWNTPDTKPPVSSTKVEVEAEGWGTPAIDQPKDNSWSETAWGSSNKSVSEPKTTQNSSSSSWTAKPENVGWGQVDVTNQSNDSSSGWGEESENWSRQETSHQETSHQHRRGRGYLSQKMENEATTVSFHAEQEQKESGWESFHNAGDEDSDVEIILEAEEEPEWLKQEQVLGMIAPGDADTSSQSPKVFSSSSVENSPRRYHHHQGNYSPHFDSRKPRQNKPRRQFDENWRRRKEDQPPAQQQPIPMYYPTPQHMNGANIAYVPMIPNANYFHMGSNVQPSAEGANTNKFYGPLPPGFEANGMVYYGVDPNLYPPQQPFYYYVPMNGNVGGSSLIYDKSTSPNELQAGEDEDEGWGPSPDIHEGEEQWNPHNDRGHRHQAPSNAVNYNNPLYYYYPQQPQNHF